MAKLVTGVFRTRAAAERAIDELVHFGFSRDDVSLLMSDATIGGVIGAIAAGLVALGIIVVPGLGLVAAGPVVATLAGLGAGAAAGGLTGALIGLGLPEREARFYNEEVERGGILVGVYTHDDRIAQAKKILDAAEAESVR